MASFIVYIVLAIYLENDYSYANFVVNPVGTTVMVGDNVTLNCIIRKESEVQISWKLAGAYKMLSNNENIIQEDHISSSQFNRISISGNHSLGEYNLNFQDVQFEDAGSYTCGYLSIIDQIFKFSPEAALTVIRPPLCQQYLTNIEPVPGSYIQLICTSQNDLHNSELTWITEGQEIVGGLNDRTAVSKVVSYLLTEDSFGQPFKCVELLYTITYTPSCSIIPLKSKSVYILQSSENVREGDSVQLTCVTRHLGDDVTYHWNGTASMAINNNIAIMNSTSLDDNGVNITCSAFINDVEFIGNNTITLYVSPQSQIPYTTEPIGMHNTGVPPVHTTQTINGDRALSSSILIGRSSVYSSNTLTLSEEYTKGAILKGYMDLNPANSSNTLLEGYMLIFISVTATVGLLLIVTIMCLALVLTRRKEPTEIQKVSEANDMIDLHVIANKGCNELEPHSSVNKNTISETHETQVGPPLYFTLDPELKEARNNRKHIDGKHRKLSKTVSSLTKYSNVSKCNETNSYHVPNVASNNEGSIRTTPTHQISGIVSAYAVTPIVNDNSKRSMSVQRPLPKRPNNHSHIKLRSNSESKINFMLKRCDESSTEFPNEGDGTTCNVTETNDLTKQGPSLTIDIDYTEFEDRGPSTIKSCSMHVSEPYDFTPVYDSLEDNKCEKKTEGGHHDNYTVQIDDEPICETDNKCQTAADGLISHNQVIRENEYASLEDTCPSR